MATALDMRECIACKKPIRDAQADYYQCSCCGTYNYISQFSATEENNAYFNDIYLKVEDFKISEAKSEMFNKFLERDRKLRADEYNLFEKTKDEISEAMSASKKILEIGFGEGENLSRLLKKGIDAEGVDISEEAIRKFKRNFPEYASKVRLKIGATDKKYDFIYCSALFEHLDDVKNFLSEIFNILEKDGVLVIDNLPIMSEKRAHLNKDNDICFWKPCHRAIYSVDGLKILFKNSGYVIEKVSSIDNFNYRVLSLLLKYGYKDIVYLRNPVLENTALPGSMITYLLCRKALKIHSLAKQSVLIIKKDVNKLAYR